MLLAAAPGTSARTRNADGIPVPQGFVGIDVDGPMISPADGVNLANQFDQMVKNGVQTVRVAFSWAAAQPYQSWADVPPAQASQFVNVGGVPTNFEVTDQIVGLAVQYRLSVLPTVLYAPGWDQGENRSGLPPPARTAPYANYLTALADRYGSRGSYWHTHHPYRPVRMWQIWNEPNISAYWPQPFAKGYVALLSAAHAAIKRADRGARVVLGALTNRAWIALGQIDRQPGARRLFDVVSVNAFTATPTRELLFLYLVRRALNRLGGQDEPLIATEVSWPSARGEAARQFDWDTTESGQARNIATVLPMLAAERQALGLAGFYYYTWMGDESERADNFSFAGLLGFHDGASIVVKPALAAYRRAALRLEGCRSKGHIATVCVK